MPLSQDRLLADKDELSRKCQEATETLKVGSCGDLFDCVPQLQRLASAMCCGHSIALA